MFNSSEKRLARTLLLLARYGKPDQNHRVLPDLSGNARANDRLDARARELLHEQIQEARVHRVQRRPSTASVFGAVADCTARRRPS
jgi:hypothetical protein